MRVAPPVDQRVRPTGIRMLHPVTGWWRSLSRVDRNFGIGTVFIVVMTLLNLRDWLAGVIGLGFWVILWGTWRGGIPAWALNWYRVLFVVGVLGAAWYVFLGPRTAGTPASLSQSSPTARASATLTAAASVVRTTATPVATASPAFCSRTPTDSVDLILYDVACVPANATPADTLLVAVPGWTRGPIDDFIAGSPVAEYRAQSGHPAVVSSLELEIRNVPNTERARANADLTTRGYATLTSVDLGRGVMGHLATESNLSRVVLSFSSGIVVYEVTARIASGVRPTESVRTAMSEYVVRFGRDYTSAAR